MEATSNNLAVTQFLRPVIQFTSEDTRLNLAIRAVNRIVNTGPSVLSDVIVRAKKSCDDSDDLREIMAFCGALAAEMQDGSVKEYLTRLQAATEELAEALDIDEDHQLCPDELTEGKYFIIEINGCRGDLVISLTPEGKEEIESRIAQAHEDWDPDDEDEDDDRIFCEMLLDDERLAFEVLSRDAVCGYPHMPIVSDDFDEVDGKAVRVGRAWYPNDPQDDEQIDDELGFSDALAEYGRIEFYLISGFERFPGAEKGK